MWLFASTFSFFVCGSDTDDDGEGGCVCFLFDGSRTSDFVDDGDRLSGVSREDDEDDNDGEGVRCFAFFVFFSLPFFGGGGGVSEDDDDDGEGVRCLAFFFFFFLSFFGGGGDASEDDDDDDEGVRCFAFFFFFILSFFGDGKDASEDDGGNKVFSFFSFLSFDIKPYALGSSIKTSKV